jgi:hypothetical protein
MGRIKHDDAGIRLAHVLFMDYKKLICKLAGRYEEELERQLKEFISGEQSTDKKLWMIELIQKGLRGNQSSLAKEALNSTIFSKTLSSIMDGWYTYNNAIHFDVANFETKNEQSGYEKVYEANKDIFITHKIGNVHYAAVVIRIDTKDLGSTTAMDVYSDKYLSIEGLENTSYSQEQALIKISNLAGLFVGASDKKFRGLEHTSFIVNETGRMYVGKGSEKLYACEPSRCGYVYGDKEIYGKKWCQLSGRKKKDCCCYTNSLSPDKVLGLACYCLEKYEKQANAIEVTDGHSETHRIASIAMEKEDEDGYISKTIPDIIRVYRNRIVGKGLGGHHASPVEHERKSHLRHYSSGKVVEVKCAVINKGNRKRTVYKV